MRTNLKRSLSPDVGAMQRMRFAYKGLNHMKLRSMHGLAAAALFAVGLFGTMGCGGTPAGGLLVVEAARSGFDRPRAIQHGREHLKVVKQIESLPGPCTHVLTGPNGRHADGVECGWVAVAYFGGRYQLEMSMPVIVDRSTSTITRSLAEPKFQLLEMRKIDGPSISYGGPAQREISLAEWEQVAAAGGDFSVVGITLSKLPPLPGYEELVASVESGNQ